METPCKGENWILKIIYRHRQMELLILLNFNREIWIQTNEQQHLHTFTEYRTTTPTYIHRVPDNNTYIHTQSTGQQHLHTYIHRVPDNNTYIHTQSTGQ